MQRPLLLIFTSALLTFLGYAAVVEVMPFRITKGQNQSDTNMMIVQDYLAKPDSDIVLVGSSLTFRLPLPVLGPHIANLSMAGGAPSTGLTLIDRSEARPKLVLIEINLLSDRSADMAAVQSSLRFPERELRSHLRALHTGYDPVNVIERGIQTLLHRGEYEPEPPPYVRQKLIADQHQNFLHPPDAERLRNNLAQIETLVSTLQSRGIRIGFFEMPIDPRLADLPGAKILRTKVAQRFPLARFCWLMLSVPGGAQTLDGIHLNNYDAAIVAGEVLQLSALCLKS